MRQLLIQQSFSSGELSPTIRGQIDLQKRQEGLEECTNLIPLKQGPVVRRGGLEYMSYKTGDVDLVGTEVYPTFLIPFQASNGESWILEMGYNPYSDRSTNSPTIGYSIIPYNINGVPAQRTYGSWTITGMTNATEGVFTYAVPSGTSPYNTDPIENTLIYIVSTPAGVSGIAGKIYRVVSLNGGARTFKLSDGAIVNGLGSSILNTTNSGTWSGNGTAHQLEYEKYYRAGSGFSFPYKKTTGSTADNFLPSVSDTSYMQVGDVAYITNQVDGVAYINYSPLIVGSDGKWDCSRVQLQDGPYLDQNVIGTANMTVSSGLADNPSITINSIAKNVINQGAGFIATDVGRLIRWRPSSGGTWSWYRIETITSSTVVQTTRLGSPPYATTSSSTSSTWRLGLYYIDNYPTAITLFQNRICLSGAPQAPDRVDMSVIGGYGINTINFSPSATDGTVTDDSAVAVTLDSPTVNTVVWMYPDSTGLAVGTIQGEWVITSSTGDRIVTPSSKATNPVSFIGTQRYVQPIQATSSIIFASQLGRLIYDLTYAFEIEKLKPRDLSLLSETLMEGEAIIQLTFQPDPYNVIWALTNQGNLYGCSYYPDGQMFGWFRLELGGSGSKVSSISLMKGDNSLWASVYIPCSYGTLPPSPPVNYQRGQFNLVRLKAPFNKTNTISQSFYLDHAKQFTSTIAFNTIYGFTWARGKTMRLLLNGKQTSDVVVTSDGRIVFPSGQTATTALAGFPTEWRLKTTEINLQGQRGTTQGRLKRLSNIILKVYNSLGMKYGSSSTTLDEYFFDNADYTTTTPALFSGNTDNLPIPWGYDQSGYIYLESDSCYPFMLQAIMTEGKPSED